MSSIEKITPQNLEAEQSLLGALLLDKDAVVKISDRVYAEDFYADKHRLIYTAISELYRRHEPIDLLALVNRLQEKEELEAIGGRAYLIELSNAVPTASNVVHYADIVQKKATLRRLLKAASDITALGYEQAEDVETVLDHAEQKLFNVSKKFLKAGFTPIHDVLDTAFERIDEVHRERGKLRGLATSYADLDNMLGGLQKSDLIILAARPSCGKTSLALDIARHVATKQKVPVGIFSLEMSKDQLVDRLICSEASVDLWKMRTGKLSDDGTNDDFSRIGHAIGVLSEAPIYIDDSASANIMEIRTKARRLQMEYGLGLVVVDYLQLMESRTTSYDNRVQEVTEITRGLKAIARELNVPVLALSQLSRQVELQKPAIPRLAHLRESGCLTGDTLIVRADTGEQVYLKDIVNGKVPTPFPVFALDNEWKIVTRPMTKAFSSGKKMVYELQTRSGRSIRASANHPFRTLDGWHALEELKPKTRIALPRILEAHQIKDRITLNELTLLAHLLGDGCTVPHQPIHYTSADQENIATVECAASSLFGIKPRRVKQKNWWHVYLPSPYHLTHGKRHPITEWLINLGIGLRHSYQKEIPAAVFTCSHRHQSHFLHHLWATDGNISWKNMAGPMPSATIYYCSTSKKLAQGVQHLLLRLGILSTLRTVSQGKYRPRYEVQIQDAKNQIAFLELVGCHGQRGKIIHNMLVALRAIKSNPNLDSVPREAWDAVICGEKERIGCSWRKLSAALGTKYCGSTLMQSGIGRERMARIALALRSKQIQALAESDVYWDEIVSITKQGMEEVYDASVPGLHNFVANDIIVHNSIEQDADIVLFIYRKAVDKNYRTEDLSPEEKNLAEIHIAKHRNGPTGQIKLFFDAARVSFRSLNKPSAGHSLPPALPRAGLHPAPPPTTPFDPNTPITTSN